MKLPSPESSAVGQVSPSSNNNKYLDEFLLEKKKTNFKREDRELRKKVSFEMGS